MGKKITVTLSDKAAKYFAEVQYALPGKDGEGVATNSDVINESLETLFDFEKETDNQLRNWLDDYLKFKGVAKKFLENPTTDTLSAFLTHIHPSTKP